MQVNGAWGTVAAKLFCRALNTFKHVSEVSRVNLHVHGDGTLLEGNRIVIDHLERMVVEQTCRPL